MKTNFLYCVLAGVMFVGVTQAKAGTPESSTASNPKWYRVYTPNRSNYALTSYGIGVKMKGTTPKKPYYDNVLWRFEKTSEGTYNIVCMDGAYIDPSRTVSIGGNYAFTPTATEPSQKWTVAPAADKDDLYTICNGDTQLHQGESGSGYYVINWGGGTNVTDAGCLFRFEAQELSELETLKAKALGLLNSRTEKGINPGQYSSAARTAFQKAITSSTTAEQFAEAEAAYLASMNKVEAGTTYFLKSSPSMSYCEGKYIYSNGSTAQPKWGDKLASSKYAWTFEDAGDGKFYIRNYYTGEYIEPDNGEETTGAVTTSATPKTKYAVTSLGQSAFNITPEGKSPLHAQNNGAVLVMWNGGLGSASAWQFEAVTKKELYSQMKVQSVSVSPGIQTYAPGNTDEVLLKFQVDVEGFKGSVTLNTFTIGFSDKTTNAAADLENVKLYLSANEDFISNGQRDATLIGTTSDFEDNTATITVDEGLAMSVGTSTFYVTADIKNTATVGNAVDATLNKITYNTDEKLTVKQNNPEGVAYIYDVASKPYQPYDKGSHYWRIPAMIVLRNQTGDNASKNGRVVTMADNRFTHNGDLPNHIDVYERHSDDGGKTWSEHKFVVGSESDEKFVNVANKGFGDVALVETGKGKLIAIMASGQGYFSSTPSSPITPMIITSDDGGDTWSSLQSLYDVLYKTSYPQGQVQGSFAGSGRGLVLERQQDESRNGRVMFAMSHRFPDGVIYQYIIYSDDEGMTWKMSSQSAYTRGDESKLVELADGTVMISVRQSGNRGFNTSADGGDTWGVQRTSADIWGNACNADILYYNKHILLHSYINDSSRKNLTVCASLDNGKTWGNKRVICAPASAYSTMDLTEDGKIAILFEDASCSSGYVLNYVSFPIDWVVEGDPARKLFEAALSKAKTIVDSKGYTDAGDAEVGEYSQESIDLLKAVIPTESEMSALTDYDGITAKLEEAVNNVVATRVTVAGHENTALFTLSSYENIASSAPYFINKEGKAEANTNDKAQLWQFLPADGNNQVYVKAYDEDIYLHRTVNSADVVSVPAVWELTKGAGEYYHLRSTHERNTYMVINVDNGSLNFWSNTGGNAQWSTKFVLTAMGTVGIEGVEEETAAQEVFYDLSGRRLGKRPAKGVYISSDRRKYMVK